jgi:hypothetical protein
VIKAYWRRTVPKVFVAKRVGGGEGRKRGSVALELTVLVTKNGRFCAKFVMML